MDEKLIDQVDSLAEQYAKERGKDSVYQGPNHNAVYALVDRVGSGLKTKKVAYHTCFGRLSTLQYEEPLKNMNSPEALFIQMQKGLYGDTKEFDKEFHLYYEWLFNFSPFRDAFISKDAAKTIDRGVIVVDTNIDSRIMIGGAITTRHPWESFSSYREQFKHIMALWKEMVEKGMNPNYAFVLAFGFRLQSSDNSWMVTGGGFGHHALNYGDYDVYLNLHSNFANDRKRSNKVPTYREAKTYKSPSELFGLKVEGEHANFHQWLTKHTAIAATGKAKKVNPFGITQTTTVTKDKLIPHFMDLQSEFVKAA